MLPASCINCSTLKIFKKHLSSELESEAVKFSLSVVVVGIIRWKPILAHASIACEACWRRWIRWIMCWCAVEKLLTHSLTYEYRRATKVVAGMQDFNYNDRLKMLSLQRLEEWRMRSDLIELVTFGIHESTLQWIKSFLEDRQMRVTVKGSYSHWVEVISGVPQGSVL